MKKYKPPFTREAWEKSSTQYSNLWTSAFRKWISQREMSFVVNGLLKYLSENKKNPNKINILDIGSGTGRILSTYLENFTVKKIYSVDYANNMVKFVEEKFKEQVRAKKCDISKELPNFGIKFDFISSIRVIKYTPDWHIPIENVYKLLKPGGYFVFTLPNKKSISYLNNDNWHKVSYSGLKKALEERGFEIIKSDGFMRIPDFLYDYSILYYPNVILETLFGFLLKKHWFAREMFILAKKI